MEAQAPSVGRIVHYVQDSEHLAAIIVAVFEDDTVNLTVFNATGATFSAHRIAMDAQENPPAATWHWPERV